MFLHVFELSKFTNKSTNWLKAEQLEIQTPLKKIKIKTKQNKLEIQTDPTSTSRSVVSIINKEWIYDIDISRIELQFTIFKLIK